MRVIVAKHWTRLAANDHRLIVVSSCSNIITTVPVHDLQLLIDIKEHTVPADNAPNKARPVLQQLELPQIV